MARTRQRVEELPAEGRRRSGLLRWLLPLIVLLALVWWASRLFAPEPRMGGNGPEAVPAPSEAAGRAPEGGRESDAARGPARDAAPAAPETDRATDAGAAASPVDAPATPAAEQREAMEALTTLDPDFTPEELVAALNRGRIDFAPSSAAIAPDARAVLETAAKTILALPTGTRLEIAGHTDSAGEPRRNRQLSQARAEAVRNVLVELGVPSVMLVPQGYGDSRPVASNDTAEGRRQNRRIEFTLLGAGEG